jgi:hypothetical protein
MKIEKRQLIHDLFENENQGETALLAGTRILRRRRYRRVAMRISCLTLVMATAATLWFENQNPNRLAFKAPATTPTSRPPAPKKVEVQSLTDDELLSLFPNTPVGLVTLSNGRKILIFPRPGDEERFVTRL